uniref:DUF3077 domain-containing protein n=1 Tax=Pseudomonas laurentiana TaxID=2364649 RepID=UPI0029C87A1D|nr:DUF3077 domain-containing protein [Pseudomonas laurentiana]
MHTSDSPPITTAHGVVFHCTGDAHQQRGLFCVADGVPLADALTSISDLLAPARAAVYAAAMGEQALAGDSAWLVHHSLDSAKAVVDALIGALNPP